MMTKRGIDLIEQLIWNFADIRDDEWFEQISWELKIFLNYENLSYTQNKGPCWKDQLFTNRENYFSPEYSKEVFKIWQGVREKEVEHLGSFIKTLKAKWQDPKERIK